jgi:hypothetical protein
VDESGSTGEERDAGVDERGRPTEPVRLSAELAGELARLGTHPLREVHRLEQEAERGENPATPAILLVGVALSAWTLVAIVIAAAFLVAHFVA